MEAHQAFPWTCSSAGSVISSDCARTSWFTSSSLGTVISTRARFLKDLISASSSGCATRRSGASLPQAPTSSAASLVEGASKPTGSSTPSEPRSACAERALRIAARRALRFTFDSKLRIIGGKARPPPVQCGARIDPARARPVPFWRHGLERPPATKPRLLPPRVPARAAFSSARTVSCTRCALGSVPNTASSSVRLFADLPALSRTGALGAATAFVLPDLDKAVPGARHRALDQEEIPLRIDFVHLETDLRDALAAQAAGHLLAFEDARRRCRGANRARLAHVVRAV